MNVPHGQEVLPHGTLGLVPLIISEALLLGLLPPAYLEETHPSHYPDHKLSDSFKC